MDCSAFGDGQREHGDALFTEATAMNQNCQLSGLTASRAGQALAVALTAMLLPDVNVLDFISTDGGFARFTGLKWRRPF